MPDCILIVDDDPVQRRLLSAAVSRAGHEVLTADRGQAALEIVDGPRRRDIAVIVLDLMMPGLDGSGVLKAAAAARNRHPGDRADRPGRHRDRGLGDARRRLRLRRQAGVARPAEAAIDNALKVEAVEDEVTRSRRRAAAC